MKKLTKIRLINWHYLANETISLKNNILLSGPNASGKSTILDALTYVITAGDTKFNLAANEKGKRDLRSYIKCKLGVEEREYLREGDVTGHIACEFYDETLDSYFIVGVVMDAFGDLTPVKSLFYYADNQRVEDSLFVNENNMIYSTVEFRKKNSSFDFYLSKSEAKRGFRTAFGSINEDFFRMISKAMAFKPISDVKEFIYQNILEEKQIDVSSIKDSIRSYRDLEATLQVIKGKISDLHEIEQINNELNEIKERKDYLTYLMKLFEVESFEQRRKDMETQIEVLKDKKESKISELRRIETYIDQLNDQARDLYSVLSNNEDFKAEEFIERQIQTVKADLRDLDGVEDRYIKRASIIKDTVNQVRRTNDNNAFKEFAQLSLQNIDPLAIENTKRELISFDSLFQEMINNNLIETGKLEIEKAKKVEELAEVRHTLASLSNNNLRYNPDLIGIRQDIIDGLKRIYSKDISVHIFAELIDIKNKEWAKTIEAFLGNRRFDLVVEPKYYDTALEIFARNKNKYRSYGLGLVNTQEMYRFDRYEKNSLASIMNSNNEDARRYINFTCGQVIMCEHESELKQYNTSITNDGLIYRGFVVRNMNLNVDRFIGKGAVGEQTEYWNNRASELKDEYYQIVNKLNNIESENQALRSLELKYLLQDLEELLQYNNLNKQLQELNVKKNQAKNNAVSDVQFEYDKTNATIKDQDNKKILTSQEIGALEQSIQTLRTQVVDMISQRTILETELKDLMQDNLEIETRAKEEYKELVHAGSIQRAFADIDTRFKTEQANYDILVDGLINKQMKYVNTYASTLSIGLSEVETFLKELNKLEKSDLVKYEQKVRSARETAEIIFKEDYISKVRNNIVTAEAEISKINETLRAIRFGRDSYEFIFPKSQEFGAFYDMFKSENISDGRSIFTFDFEQQYNQQLDELFTSLAQDELNSQGAINRFTDYRTYMDYDIKITNEFGETMLYSKVFKEKSGGETQVPFYVAIIASFVRIYSQNKTSTRDSIGLVIFDEVFDKMDANRMKSMMEFISTMPLQVIIACPPQRMGILREYTDTTLVMVRKNNRAQVLPFQTNEGYDVTPKAGD